MVGPRGESNTAGATSFIDTYSLDYSERCVYTLPKVYDIVSETATEEVSVTRYGERLRELRAERQLSLREVEEKGGPHKDTMSLAERGVHKPHAQTLGRIAKAFGMSVSELNAELEAANRPEGQMPFDIDQIKQDVIKKTRPGSLSELQKAVEEELERRYSDEDLLVFKEEQLALVEELAPEKLAKFDSYAKAVESANYVRRVLERTAGPQHA